VAGPFHPFSINSSKAIIVSDAKGYRFWCQPQLFSWLLFEASSMGGASSPLLWCKGEATQPTHPKQ